MTSIYSSVYDVNIHCQYQVVLQVKLHTFVRANICSIVIRAVAIRVATYYMSFTEVSIDKMWTWLARCTYFCCSKCRDNQGLPAVSSCLDIGDLELRVSLIYISAGMIMDIDGLGVISMYMLIQTGSVVSNQA
jgi:hypothetical protein